MTEDEAGNLIAKAAAALAKPNRDGSINDDRVNLMIEELLTAAEILCNGPPPRPTLKVVPHPQP
jgi:hypothetical protein